MSRSFVKYSGKNLEEVAGMYWKIKELLDERGLTFYQLSKAVGISQAAFTQWKNGRSKPKFEAVAKIANFLGVPVSHFYGEEFSGQTRQTQINNGTIGGDQIQYGSTAPSASVSLSSALEGLNTVERRQVIDFAMFLKSKRR